MYFRSQTYATVVMCTPTLITLVIQECALSALNASVSRITLLWSASVAQLVRALSWYARCLGAALIGGLWVRVPFGD